MVTAPSALVTGSLGALSFAASLSHDVGLAWIGVVLTIATGAGFKWLLWSIKRSIDDRVDAKLREYGVIEEPHVARPKRRGQ